MDKEDRDFKVLILILQTIFFSFVIAAALILKSFFGDIYVAVTREYGTYFCQETRLEDLFGSAPSYSDFDEDYTVYSE